jgi:peptidoglycan/LPS O-acetylase OafA/YrhL
MLSERPASMQYRPDIDGLRALAVVLVIFDHLHIVTGGYIGVDVFFVISGYLISSVILLDVRAGRFSIVAFYERRIRRIIPALFFMLLVTSILAFRHMMPSELIAFVHSMLAAAFSISNVLFWHQAGYFDVQSELKPLLHTWSLGVEEQFYVVFPLLLLAAQRWAPTRLKTVVWVAAGVTFVGACLWMRRDASAVFFLAPFRAWELLIGTAVSQRYVPEIKGRIGRNFASLFGLLLIMWPALKYTAETPFPGWEALPPCIGAALLIAAGETGSSLVGRALSWRPIVFLGLISYSLYLWHWPILVFQSSNYLLMERPVTDRLTKLVILILSLLAGTLSWWMVERPFRKGGWRPARKPLFLIAGGSFVLLTIFGAGVLLDHGAPSRFPPQILQLASFEQYQPDRKKPWRNGVCYLNDIHNFRDFKPGVCLISDSGRKRYLLYGDSTAADLYFGFSRVFPGVNFQQATAALCRPFMIAPVLGGRFGHTCQDLARFMYGTYLPGHPVDTVILAGSWSEKDLPELGRDIAWIKQHGMEVVVVGPRISFDKPLPHLLITAIQLHNPDILSQHYSRSGEVLDRKMAALARDKWNVHYISVYEDLCHQPPQGKVPMQTLDGCPLYASPGVPLTFDEHHFTGEGSVRFAQVVRSARQLP